MAKNLVVDKMVNKAMDFLGVWIYAAVVKTDLNMHDYLTDMVWELIEQSECYKRRVIFKKAYNNIIDCCEIPRQLKTVFEVTLDNVFEDMEAKLNIMVGN